MLSRLKGIETFVCRVKKLVNELRAYMLSRLKGIETFVCRVKKLVNELRAYMLSRLKGIETFFSQTSLFGSFECIYAFPFEGN